MTSHDVVRRELGVYVLGALDPAERDRIEEHLAQCADCRDEVASLAVLPSLLHRVDPDRDIADAPPVGGVIARLRAERRRVRLRTRLLTFAAVLTTAIAIVTVVTFPRAPVSSPGQEFVGADGTVTATVDERAWGMAVTITAEALPRHPGFVAMAVADDGHRTQVASWSHTGGPVTVEGACYLEPDDVASVEILAAPDDDVVAVLQPSS